LLLTLICLFSRYSGSIAVGFFGNEEVDKGVQSTVEAIQDANETLSASLETVSIHFKFY